MAATRRRWAARVSSGGRKGWRSAPSDAFLAHAAAIDLGACDEAAGWAPASAAPAAHLGLDEFATYAFERRGPAPSSFPPTEHPAAAEL